MHQPSREFGVGLIRLLLALSVLVDHSAPIFGLQLAGGEMAVLSFYAVSGFYMTMILSGPYAGRIGDFFRNRFLRLFPMYWATLGLAVVPSIALWIATAGERAGSLYAWRQDLASLGPGATLLVCFSTPFLFLQELTCFFAADPTTGGLLPVVDFRQASIPLCEFLPVPPSWSLSLELYFYLLAPWIVRWRIRSIALFAGSTLLGWIVLFHGGLGFDPWTYRFFPTSISFFLMGALSWKIGDRFGTKRFPRRIAIALWILLLGAILAWNGRIEMRSIVFVAVLAASLPTVFQLTRDWKWDRWIGDISFPLYLVHWEIFALLKRQPVPVQFVAALAAAIALQTLVGAPIERWRAKVRH